MSSKKQYSLLGDQSHSYSSLAKCKAPHSIPSTATPIFDPGTRQERQNSLCSLRKGSSIKPFIPTYASTQSCWLERSEEGTHPSPRPSMKPGGVRWSHRALQGQSGAEQPTHVQVLSTLMRNGFICRKRPIQPPFPNPKSLPVHSETIQVWGGILARPESNEHFLSFPGFLS